MRPLFSIIMVVYNNREGAKVSLASLEQQTCSDFELLIIDGGSTDGTNTLIKQYSHLSDYVISEKDKGIYDAMNKGLLAAKGDWVFYLNGGDQFYEADTLEKVSKELLKTKASVVYGDFFIAYPFMRRLQKANLPLKELWTRNVYSHQSVFINRSLLLKHPFDTQYKYVADFDLFFKLYHAKVKHLYLEMPISIFQSGGVSEQRANDAWRERRVIIQPYQPSNKVKIHYFFKGIYLRSNAILKPLLPDFLLRFFTKWKYKK